MEFPLSKVRLQYANALFFFVFLQSVIETNTHLPFAEKLVLNITSQWQPPSCLRKEAYHYRKRNYVIKLKYYSMNQSIHISNKYLSAYLFSLLGFSWALEIEID